MKIIENNTILRLEANDAKKPIIQKVMHASFVYVKVKRGYKILKNRFGRSSIDTIISLEEFNIEFKNALQELGDLDKLTLYGRWLLFVLKKDKKYLFKV